MTEPAPGLYERLRAMAKHQRPPAGRPGADKRIAAGIARAVTRAQCNQMAEAAAPPPLPPERDKV